MQSRFAQTVKDFLQQAQVKAAPFLFWVKSKRLQLAAYFRAHPRMRRAAIILSVPAFVFFLILFTVWIEIPSKRKLRNIQNQVASEIYSADSVLLGRYYVQDRTEVTYQNISPVVIDALIATEDIRFYDHSGVDYRSLGRVLVKSIFMQDESAGGGSTITQQLAKNLYPRKRYWFFSMLINKLREFFTAIRIEGIYTKEQILTMYLNTIPFADNAYGIETAAQRFYSVSAKDLTTTQAAVLIGMLKATHYYNPRLFSDRSLRRRNVVLWQMVKNNKLKKESFDSLKTLPLALKYNVNSSQEEIAPYFREFVRTELDAWCRDNVKEDGSPYNLFTDGLKIYTTLDSRLQRYAESAVAKQLSRLQKTFYDHWGNEMPWKGKERVLDEAIQRSVRFKKLEQAGLSEDEIMQEMEKPVPMKIFTWQGVKDEVMSPVDSVIHYLQFLNAGFLALDPTNGQIKVWVGGINHDFFPYDHVKISTKRQVGSIFKPFVYAMALERGVRPCELTPSSQQTYVDKEGKLWTPRNVEGVYNVDYTMRGALAYSINTVAAKMIQRAGVDDTKKLAHSMGIISEIPDVPSIALGSSSISLMEMTTAYACLANDGVTVSPYFITSIKNLEGKLFTDFKPEQKNRRTISKKTSALITHLLRTVVQEGTASSLRWQYGVYTDVAGKTGTTQSNADGWFMAMTPKLVMGTWVGADDPRIRFRSGKLGQGSASALPVAGYFLQEVVKDPKFKDIAAARFPTLPDAYRDELGCDLYEMSDSLMMTVERTVNQRDSLMRADTLAVVPEETFLQILYRRKMRIREANASRDTVSVRIEN